MIGQNSKTELIEKIKTKMLSLVDKNSKEELRNYWIKEKNLSGITIGKLLLNNYSGLNDLSTEELIWLIEGLKLTGIIINPKDYFTEFELNKSKVVLVQSQQKLELPVAIKNVMVLGKDRYATTVHISFFKQLSEAGLMVYNPLTQRAAKIDHFDGNSFEVPNISPLRVADIKTLMLSGDYEPTFVTLNVLKDGENEIVSKGSELFLTKGVFNEIDGAHRIQAILDALVENPELDMNFGLIITHYDIKKAQNYIWQENQGEKYTARQLKVFKDSAANNIVDLIERNINADRLYRDKIVKSFDELKNDKFLLFDVLSETLQRSYVLEIKESQSKCEDISNWVTQVLNFVVDYKFDEFSNVVESKKKSYITHYKIFPIFIILSAKLKDDVSWKEKLTKIIDNLDFSKENEMIKPVMSASSELAALRELGRLATRMFNGVISSNE